MVPQASPAAAATVAAAESAAAALVGPSATAEQVRAGVAQWLAQAPPSADFPLELSPQTVSRNPLFPGDRAARRAALREAARAAEQAALAAFDVRVIYIFWFFFC